jgi:hypothetical protein
MLKTEMSSLWQVMSKLRDRGFRLDFSMAKDGKMLCSSTNREFAPEEVCIDRVYRFEGESDPGDMSVLYALETKTGEKGLFVDAYGAGSSLDCPAFDEFIKKVPIKRDLGHKHHEHEASFGERIQNFLHKLFSQS